MVRTRTQSKGGSSMDYAKTEVRACVGSPLFLMYCQIAIQYVDNSLCPRGVLDQQLAKQAELSQSNQNIAVVVTGS